jgi:hypothetical protein
MRPNDEDGKSKRSRDLRNGRDGVARERFRAGGWGGAAREDTARLDDGVSDTVAATSSEPADRIERVTVELSVGRRTR